MSAAAGTRDGDAKKESQVKKRKTESTEARAEDGSIGMCDEASVMGAEQRAHVIAT